MISTIGKYNLKKKNEIIEMNRNYINISKKIWTDIYVHAYYAYDKKTLDM